MAVKLIAKNRDDLKRSQTREYRLSGLVPAVLYGKKLESQPVVVDSVPFIKALREVGRNGIFSLSVEGNGKTHQVIVHDLQTDSLKGGLLHIDFFEVDMKSELDANVAVRLTGEAPGSKEGGVVSHLLYELSVRALPADIPEEIEVDISNLGIGDSIQVSDLTHVDSFEINNDPEETIVTITAPAAEKEPEQTPEEEVEEAAEEKQEE
ncbi:50S ribosomal protein L25/general stress protein Ctc [Desertibacillus haloalkaliphilus]|uniref:50S ribosomal protein L25/general stress protein Ctc n=1 Tax=Desertibacillus haloalkaliphilus TaxID=1328930 RepID=UPI001C2564B1|nr:50S ribosomal protein L25/general stress protein Ctc [Desertibacillus haloalkaliphilus]MBU8908430.1 50S ribosomal protein L25/general stress protein Ctc [Desertibacillus haloalkaliphilus]